MPDAVGLKKNSKSKARPCDFKVWAKSEPKTNIKLFHIQNRVKAKDFLIKTTASKGLKRQ